MDIFEGIIVSFKQATDVSIILILNLRNAWSQLQLCLLGASDIGYTDRSFGLSCWLPYIPKQNTQYRRFIPICDLSVFHLARGHTISGEFIYFLVSPGRPVDVDRIGERKVDCFFSLRWSLGDGNAIQACRLHVHFPPFLIGCFSF